MWGHVEVSCPSILFFPLLPSQNGRRTYVTNLAQNPARDPNTAFLRHLLPVRPPSAASRRGPGWSPASRGDREQDWAPAVVDAVSMF
jgi:hypothetical protein